MIRLFGGWQGYLDAPATVVEEQRIVWIAEKIAESELAEEQRRNPPK